MKRIDVSVVLNMHRESLYLRPTLLSLHACALEAENNGLKVELICVFDRADTDTLNVFQETSLPAFEKIKVTEIDVGSLDWLAMLGLICLKANTFGLRMQTTWPQETPLFS